MDVFLLICENAVERKSWHPVVSRIRDRESWPISPAVNTEYILPLLTLTHVCQAWRKVVIGASLFWAYADSTRMPLPLLHAFIERAGTARISHAFNPWSTNADLERAIFDASVRPLRHLTMHFKRSLGEQTTCFPIKSLGLESLAITSLDVDILDVEGSPYLFHEHTSSMRALALSPIPRLLPRDSFPNLTHLYISFARQALPGVNPLDDLFRLLSQAPKIQFLGIYQISHIFPPQDPSTYPLLHLPQMRNLTIRDTHWLYPRYLLGHLSFREDIHVYSRGLWLSRQGSDESALIGLPRVSLPCITRMKLEARFGSIHMVMEGPLDSTQRPQGRLDVTFSYRSSYLEDDPWENILIRSLREYSPVSCILTLHILLHDQLQLEFATNVIPHMEKLVELVVLLPVTLSSSRPGCIGGNAHLFTGLLHVLQQTNPVICPALSDLGVVVFITENLSQGGNSQAVLDNILELIRARAKNGHPLRRFFTQPSNSILKEQYTKLFQFERQMKWLRERLEGWLESIRQIVEVVESVWDFEERDLEAFTSRTFCADEVANVEQYWRLSPVDSPWTSPL